MNSFNRKIAEKFDPQRAKPKKFGCLGNFLHGALRPCIFIARHSEAEQRPHPQGVLVCTAYACI